MAAKSPKTYSDLRFKFLRGLLAHEKYQRQRHYLKQASEWTSKAIVSLDLSPHPIKSVPQAAKLEGIGAETAKKLKEYLSESTLSSAPPPPGLYLTSASAILVAMSRYRELQRDTGVEGTGRIKKQDIKAWAQDTCQERFIDIGAGDLEAENTAICPAMWRLEILVQRQFIKRRTYKKEPIYELTQLGIETAARIRGIPVPEGTATDLNVSVPALPSLVDPDSLSASTSPSTSTSNNKTPALKKRSNRKRKSDQLLAEISEPLEFEEPPESAEFPESAEPIPVFSLSKEERTQLKKTGGTVSRVLVATETFDAFGDMLGMDDDGDQDVTVKTPQQKRRSKNIPPNHRHITDTTNSATVTHTPKGRNNADLSHQTFDRSKTPYQRRTFLGEPHLNSMLLPSGVVVEVRDKDLKRSQDGSKSTATATAVEENGLKRKANVNGKENEGQKRSKKKENKIVDPQLLALYTNDDRSDGLTLVLDSRELGGDRTALGEIAERLERAGVRYRTQALSVGDYLWMLRSAGRESTLPLLIERKRADDLARSLMDGRYKKQKEKMLEWKREYEREHNEVVCLQYVVEGNPKDYVLHCADGCGALVKCGFPTLAQVEAALEELRNDADFTLVRTDNLPGTVQLLQLISLDMQNRINRGDFDALLAAQFHSNNEEEVQEPSRERLQEVELPHQLEVAVKAPQTKAQQKNERQENEDKTHQKMAVKPSTNAIQVEESDEDEDVDTGMENSHSDAEEFPPVKTPSLNRVRASVSLVASSEVSDDDIAIKNSHSHTEDFPPVKTRTLNRVHPSVSLVPSFDSKISETKPPTKNKFMERYKKRMKQMERMSDTDTKTKEKVVRHQTDTLQSPARNHQRAFRINLSPSMQHISADDSPVSKRKSRIVSSTVVKRAGDRAEDSATGICKEQKVDNHNTTNDTGMHFASTKFKTLETSNSLTKTSFNSSQSANGKSTLSNNHKQSTYKSKSKAFELSERFSAFEDDYDDYDDPMPSTCGCHKQTTTKFLPSTVPHDVSSASDSDSLPDPGISTTPRISRPKFTNHGSVKKHTEELNTALHEVKSPRNIVPLEKLSNAVPIDNFAARLHEEDKVVDMMQNDFPAAPEDFTYMEQLKEVKNIAPHVDDQTARDLLQTYAGNVEAVVMTIFEEASQN